MLWVLSSLVLASVIAPWIYQGGKALAAAAATHELSHFWEWLGAACGKSKFDRFYSRSLSFSALVLLPFLFHRVRKVGAAREAIIPRVKVPWKSGLLQTAVACLIGASFLWGLAMILHAAGAYTANPHPLKTGKFLAAVLMPAIAAPLVEETLFRGILLGLWLRSIRPLNACLGSSLLFAFLHFLDPSPGFAITDPSAPSAGFQLLGSALFHFTEPRFFVTDFATLFVVGMILAWARVRTGGLWFSIGLHAGWVLAFKSCNQLYLDVPNHFLRPWGVGNNVRSGLLPMLTLGLTAVICHFVLQRFEKPRKELLAAHHGDNEDLLKSAAP
ncbi:MAG: CPBP family intramembrane glutamic endopeptidase [Luteolibacter sp.]